MQSEAAPTVKPSSLPYRDGEDPWTKADLDEVKETLADDIERFASQLAASNAELVGMLRDGAEGALVHQRRAAHPREEVCVGRGKEVA